MLIQMCGNEDGSTLTPKRASCACEMEHDSGRAHEMPPGLAWYRAEMVGSVCKSRRIEALVYNATRHRSRGVAKAYEREHSVQHRPNVVVDKVGTDDGVWIATVVVVVLRCAR